ncbi:MAG: prepilin-type N-terminal cleavage/methylation domain-containing protein [Spirochaetota bacterium]|nr:prepilin-type N-terminal cleavage/methylation domain-containing protein [Spirochaetota bacterium]
MNRASYLQETLKGRDGFTLLEIIIVIVIISVMSMFIAPRMVNYFGSARSHFVVMTTIIAKTFDDSFINDRMNFLVIHLYEPFEESEGEIDELFSRQNGVSVVNFNEKGKFVKSNNKLLGYKGFPESFKIEEVVLSTGEKVHLGNVLIPFYPQGYSDNVILHILVNAEERWSIRIYKLRKEAKVFPDYIEFESSTL